jgi:hypothetical protein
MSFRPDNNSLEFADPMLSRRVNNSHSVLEDSDKDILKNPKLLMMIWLFTFETKDELLYFLVRLNKKLGIWFLKANYDAIDQLMPMKHNEVVDIQAV